MELQNLDGSYKKYIEEILKYALAHADMKAHWEHLEDLTKVVLGAELLVACGDSVGVRDAHARNSQNFKDHLDKKLNARRVMLTNEAHLETARKKYDALTMCASVEKEKMKIR